MRYEYFLNNLQSWRYFEVKDPIVRCADCGRYESKIGVGTVCKISGRNIGRSQFYSMKPEHCPLIEVVNDTNGNNASHMLIGIVHDPGSNAQIKREIIKAFDINKGRLP